MQRKRRESNRYLEERGLVKNQLARSSYDHESQHGKKPPSHSAVNLYVLSIAKANVSEKTIKKEGKERQMAMHGLCIMLYMANKTQEEKRME